MICCIDAHIFIWGLKKECDPGDEHLRERAIHLFKFIDDNKYFVMIPTVVLGEVLAVEPLENYAVILEKIEKNFIIADFDQRASIKYAQLFMNKIDELKKAQDLLMKRKSLINVFVSDSRQLLMTGDVWIAQSYSGDAMQIIRDSPHFKYFNPKEGGIFWIDNMVIPKGARNRDLAHGFINHLLDPEMEYLLWQQIVRCR